MEATTRRGALLAGGLLTLGLVGAGTWALRSPAPDLVQGQVEATQVSLSAKIPGRVRELRAREGQTVRPGDVVALLDSPELTARMDQARAAARGARALGDKAQHGSRQEEIRAARALWQRATDAAVLARKTYERLERLHRDGVVTAQRRDEAEAQWRTADQAAQAARATYDMAEAGARSEDKEAAEAAYARAQGAVAEVASLLQEAEIVSPGAGEVAKRNVEVGELVAPGYPIVTVVDLSDVWVTLQLREDRLAGLQPGERLRARIPALRDSEIELAVFYVAAQADFATWRSTSASGGFDLKTFEVRARPVTPVAGLRPGMSAVLRWDRR